MTAARHRADKLLEPPKLSIDRMPVLHGIFERLATACTENLRQFCAEPASFFVNQLETRNTWDILESYEDSIAGVFYSPEWDSRIVIGLDRRFIFSLMEALFGGDGSEPPFESDRPFSVLETRIGNEMLGTAASALEAGFASVSQVSFRLERLETSLEFSILGQTDMPAVVAQILFQVLDHGGRMFVLIPQPALYPIRKKLEREHSPVVTSKDPRWTRHMHEGIARAEVTLQAVLETYMMTFGEIAGLRPGQILQLRANAHSLVTLECQNESLFSCRLGQSNGNFALIIESAIVQKHDFPGDILAAAFKT